MNIFYTYAYLREDGTPYYIGKGQKNRINATHRFTLPPEERRIYLKQNLTEEEAHNHERYLISVYGRKLDGGILINIKEDGGEGFSGQKHTPETIEKMKEYATGRTQSVETRRKRSEATKGKWNGGGNMGKKFSEEHKRRIGEAVRRARAKRNSGL